MKATLRTPSAVLLLLGVIGAPSLTHAIPTTWNYSGTCISGDCDVVPSVTGTVTGDPTWIPPANEVNEYVVFGDLTSWTFTVGSYSFNGTRAFGTYFLDASGNIVGGSMIFGDVFALEFLGAGAASWGFSDTDCRFLFLCSKVVEASGSGGYSASTAVPEPGMLSLIGGGLLALGFARRRRRT